MQRNQIRRKRKYTARKDRNENTILQYNKRAKVNETKKRIFRLRIQSNTRKEGNTLMKQQSIQNKDTKQHQERRNNLDERTKKSIQDKDTKLNQERRKNLDERTKKSIQNEDTK